jgi:hypothetical protein
MKNLLSSLLLICLMHVCSAQNVMLQGWYWDYPKPHQGASWADTILNKATKLKNAGFTYMWLPGFSRGSSNTYSNGYDPKDYYDLGNASSGGTTAFGTNLQVNAVMNKFSQLGIGAVADVVYNHRDGGQPEINPAAKTYVETFNATKYNNGDQPFGSDKYSVALPLGGTTGLGAGTYYFKFKSATGNSSFYGKRYIIYMWTTKTGYGAGGDSLVETALNGGSDCAQPSDNIQLQKRMFAFIDNSSGGACGVDEFKLTITSNDFFATGDNLFINIRNDKNVNADQFIYGVWAAANSADVKDSLRYYTNTNFNNLPSGRGGMNWKNFKPNNTATTCLCGDQDYPYWYNDVDQNVQSTIDTFNVYTKWLWQQVGVRGFRVDAIKHFPHAFTSQLLNYLDANSIYPSIFVGESYDFWAPTLAGHINAIKANMTPSAIANIPLKLFDFDLQANLRDACDAFGYDARNLFNAGIANQPGMSGFNAITFVNNHDFRDATNTVDNDNILAYAYILTNNKLGLPCVYYPDYYATPSYTNQFNKLLSIQNKFIAGASSHEYLNKLGTTFSANYISGAASNSLIYQLSNGGNCGGNNGVVVAINFSGNALKVDQSINTSFGYNLVPGDTLIELTGNSTFSYAIVNSSSQIYIDLPGRSYGVWLKKGIKIPNVNISAVGVTAFCKGDSVKLTSQLGFNEPCIYCNWKKNGQLITGENQPTLLALESGSYQLEVSMGGNIFNSSNTINIVVNPSKPSISRVFDTLISSAAASYLWYYTALDTLNFTTAPGVNNQQNYTINFPGKYAVNIIDQNGCSDKSYFGSFAKNEVGINNFNNNLNVKVFPNPGTQSLTIKFNGSIPVFSIEINNTLGQNIYKINKPTNIFTLVTSTWPAGVYFVKVTDSNGNVVSKLWVKE